LADPATTLAEQVELAVAKIAPTVADETCPLQRRAQLMGAGIVGEGGVDVDDRLSGKSRDRGAADVLDGDRAGAERLRDPSPEGFEPSRPGRVRVGD